MVGGHILFDGSCPECLLNGRQVFLSLNLDDVFECAECNLQIALGNLMRAVLCRRRGKGSFRDRNNTDLSSQKIQGQLLVRENADEHYRPDKFNGFKTDEDLMNYIKEIK